jgi:hypothetical protein
MLFRSGPGREALTGSVSANAGEWICICRALPRPDFMPCLCGVECRLKLSPRLKDPERYSAIEQRSRRFPPVITGYLR